MQTCCCTYYTSPIMATTTADDRAPKQAREDDTSGKRRRLFDKSLGTAASLVKLLPSGATLAFQTMAPSFTKGGECDDHDVNFAFTWGLIAFLTLLCALLSFTDSVTDRHGHVYYGIATPGGFVLFNHDLRRLELDERISRLRRRMKLNGRDLLHAALSAAVFAALAFCDAGVQGCLVPRESQPWKDFLTHLPLAVSFLASFLLIIFPCTRKGIGNDGVAASEDDDAADGADSHRKKDQEASPPPATPLPPPKKEEKEKKARRLFDKSLVSAAGLAKLLPTGTTLAFQTMAPSFTRGGHCENHGVNFVFTWWLIVFLTSLCAVLTFTDSVVDKDDGSVYYGIATCNGFQLFDHRKDEADTSDDTWWKDFEARMNWADLRRRKRLKLRDFMHAALSAAVFMAIAFCDAGVQDCLLNNDKAESGQWKQFVTLMPLAVGFVASLVFIIFPSTRHGIGEQGVWDDTTDDDPKHDPEDDATKEKGSSTKNQQQCKSSSSSSLSLQAPMGGITQVAPSSSACDDQQRDLVVVVDPCTKL